MNLVETEGWIRYRSRRRGDPPAAFQASYRATSNVFEAAPGTLEHFLTERYCLYARFPKGIYRSEIHHRPWDLQVAECEFALNTMTAPQNLTLPAIPPLLHFARLQDVRVWRPTPAFDT